MTDAQKAWIDQASYEELLTRWRFAPADDPFFQGETAEYYAVVMIRKRGEVGHDEHVRISKAIGVVSEYRG